MKTKLSIVSLAVAALVAGCNQKEPRVNETQPVTEVTAREVAESYKDTAKTTKTYVQEGKDEFVATVDKRLNQMDEKIGELANKADTLKDDTKVQADKAVAELREQRKDISAKLGELKKSSGEAWKEVKSGFASAMNDLEKAYEDAKLKFN